jgi:hypothetical protein
MLRESINQCNLHHVPQMVREVITNEYWRERFEHRVWKFNSFADFITKPFHEGGCDWPREKVEELLEKSGDRDVLRMFRGAMDAQALDANVPNLKEPHRPKKSDNTKNDVTLSDRGNSPSYALARLRRDRLDIHARVLAGEISAHAGMIEAGFRKKRPSQKRSRVERVIKQIDGMTKPERRQVWNHQKKEFGG